MRTIRLILAGIAAVGVMACSDQLVVTNENSPDAARALKSPTDVENLVGTAFLAMHRGTAGGSQVQVNTQTLVYSLESYSDLANFGLSNRSSIPRSPIDNTRGGGEDKTANYNTFQALHRAARQAATGLGAMLDPTFSFLPVDPARTQRGQAWGHFVIGAALGQVAMIFDQGAPVLPENNGQSDPVPLVPYDSLMRVAMSELNQALALAGWSGSGTIDWIPGNTMNQATFRGLVRMYKAQFRAGVARSPADRAAVDWDSVIADANAALAAFPNGLQINMSSSNGYTMAWLQTQHFASNSTNWHCMHQFMIGMADSSGAYDAWLGTPLATRTPFLVVTADRRFPQGTDRTTQRANSASVGNSGPPNPYIRNRSNPDWQGGTLGTSWYDHYRFQPWFAAGGAGLFPVIPATVIRMLAAEGYIRLGQFDNAAALINVSRTAWGLPALPNGMTASTPVPGNSGPGTTGCVPRIPVGPNYTSSACGNMLEAMKWEKRMDGAFTTAFLWYVDSRGWGDLPEGTATMWPTPFQEVDTYQSAPNPPPYTSSYGGIGGVNATPRGTYGL